VAYKYLFK